MVESQKYNLQRKKPETNEYLWYSFNNKNIKTVKKNYSVKSQERGYS